MDKALSLCRAQEADFYLSVQDLSLTRYAGNAIHQNVSHYNAQLNVRATEGKRLGRATTNDLSDEGIRRAVDRAHRNASLMPEDPDFRGLPQPSVPLAVATLDPATANCSPESRARTVAVVCAKAGEKNLEASGAYRTGTQELAVWSTRGTQAYHAGAFAGLIITTSSDSSAGWAKGGSWRIQDMDIEALAEEAVERADRGRNPRAISPGEYPVVLDHYAADDILEALSLYGMGAQAVQEGRSWMRDVMGQQAMSPLVSIWDDGTSREGWPVPFDAEGVPRQRVDIVNDGVVGGPVHNSYTAGKEGTKSTGHQAYFTGGPIASNLFMQVGDSSQEELVATIGRGIYITRFFYTRLAHSKGCVMTGMTRDGTFMVENGEVAYPVKDLRFTQSYVDALAGVEALGNESKLVLNEVGFATKVPQLRLGSFNFTGVTV